MKMRSRCGAIAILGGLMSLFLASSANSTNLALLDEGATAYDNGSYHHWDHGDMDATLAIDGNPDTHWDGLASMPSQIITVGLAHAYVIDRILVLENLPTSYFTRADFSYFDGADWQPLFSEQKSSPGMDRAFVPVLTDSVRMEIHEVEAPGSWANPVALIYALEVHGASLAPPEGVNVALLEHGAIAYDNGSYYHWDHGDMDAILAIDGNPETHWDGLASMPSQIITVGLDRSYAIDRIIVTESLPTSYFTEADFSYFDGLTWQPLFSELKSSPGMDRRFAAVVADSVRMEIHEVEAPGSWANPVALIYAFEVYGADPGTPTLEASWSQVKSLFGK